MQGLYRGSLFSSLSDPAAHPIVSGAKVIESFAWKLLLEDFLRLFFGQFHGFVKVRSAGTVVNGAVQYAVFSLAANLTAYRPSTAYKGVQGYDPVSA